MKEGIPFNSCFGSDMELFLQHRRSCIGSHQYGKEIYYLHDWDDYLVSKGYRRDAAIDEELVTSWIFSHDLAERSLNAYIGILGKFLTFYCSYNEITQPVFIPKMRPISLDYVPYLFTDGEMERIYSEVDNYSGSHPNNTLAYIEHELPVIIRLLATGGYRINELVSLSMDEVDLPNGILKLLNTKNDRQRAVPLSGSMAQMLRDYCEAMHLSEGTGLPLFPRRRIDEKLLWYDVYSRFKKTLIRLGIRQKEPYEKSRGPCLHCLRHRFCLKVLKKFIAEGMDLEMALPYLSAYLGHASLAETEHYLQFCADLFPDELARFDSASKDLYPDDGYWDQWL